VAGSVSTHDTVPTLTDRKFSISCFLDDQMYDGFIFSSSILNISVHLTFLSNNFVKCTNAQCAHRSFWLISILQENTFFPLKYVLEQFLSIKSLENFQKKARERLSGDGHKFENHLLVKVVESEEI